MRFIVLIVMHIGGHFVVLIMVYIDGHLVVLRSVVLVVVYIDGHFVVLWFVLIMVYIDRLRLLINQSGRLLFDKNRLRLVVVVVFGLIVLGHNFLIFMNFLLWFVLMMLIVIARLTLLFDFSIFVLNIPTVWLFINALILSVVGIVLIVIVRVRVIII